MMIAIWPLVVLIVGLLIYFVSSNAKPQEVGRAMIWVGLFWVLFTLVGKSLRIG
jgi:Na+/phosphate symporter